MNGCFELLDLLFVGIFVHEEREKGDGEERSEEKDDCCCADAYKEADEDSCHDGDACDVIASHNDVFYCCFDDITMKKRKGS